MLRGKIGQRVVLSRAIEVAGALLKEGETGVVMAVELLGDMVYSVEVRMSLYHLGLAMYDNEAHIAGPELSALQVLCDTSRTRKHVTYY